MRNAWLSREDVELGALESAGWFNYHDVLGPMGYVPRVEYGEAFCGRLKAQADEATRSSPPLSKPESIHPQCGQSAKYTRVSVNVGEDPTSVEIPAKPVVRGATAVWKSPVRYPRMAGAE
jgi:hypothetical protein